MKGFTRDSFARFFMNVRSFKLFKSVREKEKMENELQETKDTSCFINRELSWLSFNERVLNEAANPRVPLAERLTFASIYQTNLDEFFMVRVGTLMTQMGSKNTIKDNKTGMTSREQVDAILARAKELEKKRRSFMSS